MTKIHNIHKQHNRKQIPGNYSEDDEVLRQMFKEILHPEFDHRIL